MPCPSHAPKISSPVFVRRSGPISHCSGGFVTMPSPHVAVMRHLHAFGVSFAPHMPSQLNNAPFWIVSISSIVSASKSRPTSQVSLPPIAPSPHIPLSRQLHCTHSLFVGQSASLLHWDPGGHSVAGLHWHVARLQPCWQALGAMPSHCSTTPA